MRADWIEVKLGDVADVISGKNQKGVENPNGKYPIYGSGGIFGRADEFICEPGTTVIGRKGTINSPIYVNEQFWNVDTAFGICPINSNLKSKYLHNFCLSFNFCKLDKSTTIPSLAKRDIIKITFPLPPLPEQRAIVAKIEQLFSDLDNGITNLKTAKEKLIIYRQALLKKAFEGELTKEWRSQQTDLPTAEELLEQIKEERTRHYQQQLKEWQQAVKEWEENGNQGKKPGKPKKLNETLLLSEQNTTYQGTLPHKWSSISLDGLAKDICLGKMLDKKKNIGQLFPYLGNINVRWGEFNIANIKQMRFQQSEYDPYELKHGDLVVCEGGEPGRCAIWKTDQKMRFQKALHRLRFWQTQTLPEFVYYFMTFSAQTGQLNKHFTGTTIKHLTGAGLKNIALPLCSIKEQRQIVQELESRLSVCDKLTDSIDISMQQAEALRQSILKRAFEGKLLTDTELAACRKEPDWEPAEKLLKSVKKESK